MHLTMSPSSGEWLLRHVGDRVRFTLHAHGGVPEGWRALLRTDLGRARAARQELVATLGGARTFAGSSWRDIPLTRTEDGWSIDLALTEVGWFRAKPYAMDPEGRQHWPHGEDVGLTVHPDSYRTANTIYCAFTRMFGGTRNAAATKGASIEEQFAAFDGQGYTLIPPSGKLRDLTREIPHIVTRLGCRILHLLPITETPTTYARFGRYGSPYAAGDLVDIDPALVVFDKRSTAVDQFRELTYAAHLRGARVFLDIVVNHTGWGSTLMNEHPEWFKRKQDGEFHSPGAWGTTWEDLVELDNRFPALWEEFAESLLTWCRRGVDGFRCDAGYMVPLQAWQYIISRVRDEFPDTVFLLEGLGGAWEATESLLTQGGMQWAYSELFQNFSPREVSGYIDHSIRQGQRVGVLVHYSETHDNDRLAKRGRPWSLLRNRLSALTSQNGAFGFTCGVEWLATEKLEVHQSRGLSWGAPNNIVEELLQVNKLLEQHPAFFDGATMSRVSAPDSAVLGLLRRSAEGKDAVLVLINTDVNLPAHLMLDSDTWRNLGEPQIDLLGQNAPAIRNVDGKVTLWLAPGATYCLSRDGLIHGLGGDSYRRKRAQVAWAYGALKEVIPMEDIGPVEWQALAGWVGEDAVRFLGALGRLDATRARTDLLGALRRAAAERHLSEVVVWERNDLNRVVLVPPGHWLLVRDSAPFDASLATFNGVSSGEGAGRVGGKARTLLRLRSVAMDGHYVAAFPPRHETRHEARRETLVADLLLERFTEEGRQARGRVRFLAEEPEAEPSRTPLDGLVLLTNGRGGMARLCVDLGEVHSKYDCFLGANLHASAPTDRHVLAKRVRVWVNADGFITPLDRDNLVDFLSGPPASWSFVANAGDGRAVRIDIEADMLEGRNTTVLRFTRAKAPVPPPRRELPEERDVRLIVRLDLEDRSFHAETRRSPGAEDHFHHHTRTNGEGDRPGFVFEPAPDRRLRVYTDGGRYHAVEEWSENIPHPVEASRGMTGTGDAWSPGWFDVPLTRGKSVMLVATADAAEPRAEEVAGFAEARRAALSRAVERSGLAEEDRFGRALARALPAYLARRDQGWTVIAGYPWFLDWGRDTFISARGLLAAGMAEEVRQILFTFARFESGGTLPNMLHGEDASNRDTSDASLWFGVVCEDAAALGQRDLFEAVVPGPSPGTETGRTVTDVLRSIATGYLDGTPNGIRVDRASGLVWSPSHFTWMDTNYPAGTPRQGYPIEIQVLWIRLLRLLERLRVAPTREPWGELAERASRTLQERYWLESRGYFADQLIAAPGVSAADAVVDTALRPNFLFGISLGLMGGERARRAVTAAERWLLIPGAMRSLAPLPAEPPLAVYGVGMAEGRLLNDPNHPYWGRYEGDEDTRRKPAYHNGTGWNWLLPVFCEALVRAWDFSDAAMRASRAYLGSFDDALVNGCIGQLPENVDGDAPHGQRGTDAQAWSVSEALRVWKLLGARR